MHSAALVSLEAGHDLKYYSQWKQNIWKGPVEVFFSFVYTVFILQESKASAATEVLVDLKYTHIIGDSTRSSTKHLT